MNKLICAVLVLAVVCVSAQGPPDHGPRRGGRGGPSECEREKCATELDAFRQKPKDDCFKKCQPEDSKKWHEMDEAARKKVRDCLQENKCEGPKSTPEFQALMKCKQEKCPDDFKRHTPSP